MGKNEIIVSYKNAKHKGDQIKILAQLNDCTVEEIINILIEGGIPRVSLSRTIGNFKKSNDIDSDKKFRNPKEAKTKPTTKSGSEVEALKNELNQTTHNYLEAMEELKKLKEERQTERNIDISIRMEKLRLKHKSASRLISELKGKIRALNTENRCLKSQYDTLVLINKNLDNSIQIKDNAISELLKNEDESIEKSRLIQDRYTTEIKDLNRKLSKAERCILNIVYKEFE